MKIINDIENISNNILYLEKYISEIEEIKKEICNNTNVLKLEDLNENIRLIKLKAFTETMKQIGDLTTICRYFI